MRAAVYNNPNRPALRQAQGQPYGLSDGQTARQAQRDPASRAGAALPPSGHTSSAPTRAEENMCGQAGSPAQAGRVNRAPTKASAAAVRYSQLPQWARGLP